MIEYEGTSNAVADDSGWHSCGDEAGVVNTEAMAREEAEQIGEPYVELTGDDAADAASVENLVAEAAPDSADEPIADKAQPRDGGRKSRSNGKPARLGPAAQAKATRCQVGSFPTNYQFQSRYRVDKYDGGPLDVWIYWSFKLQRVSCAQYRFVNVQQWIERRPTQDLNWRLSVRRPDHRHHADPRRDLLPDGHRCQHPLQGQSAVGLHLSQGPANHEDH